MAAKARQHPALGVYPPSSRCQLRSVSVRVLCLFCTIAVMASCAVNRTRVDQSQLQVLASFFGPTVTMQARGSFGIDRARLVPSDQTTDVSTALRVTYPARSASPAASRLDGAPEGGMQLYLPRVKGELNRAYLRYRVRFPTGFNFVRGGKLPGLWGGTRVSGGAKPNGTDGFSTRLMWRSGGAGEVYLYALDNVGTSLGRGRWSWPTGAWTCIEQSVVLNDPSRHNGTVTVWLDGREVFKQTHMRYRSVGTLRIQGIFFSTFFGGDDSSWSSPTTQYADFAGFELSSERVGCN